MLNLRFLIFTDAPDYAPKHEVLSGAAFMQRDAIHNLLPTHPQAV